MKPDRPQRGSFPSPAAGVFSGACVFAAYVLSPRRAPPFPRHVRAGIAFDGIYFAAAVQREFVRCGRQFANVQVRLLAQLIREFVHCGRQFVRWQKSGIDNSSFLCYNDIGG